MGNSPPSQGKTVLLVDDERNVLSALRRTLRNEGYHILTANSGYEALELLKNNEVHLVISDQRMPEMTGTQLLHQVRIDYPDTVRVVLSGYADADAILGAVNLGHIYQFQTKPWNDADLKHAIQNCLTHYDFLQERRLLARALQYENQTLLDNTQYLMRFMVQRLTQLDCCQEVFVDFPLPLVGINKEHRVDILSDVTQFLLPTFERAEIGDGIQDCFPNELLALYESLINNNAPMSQHTIHLDEMDLRVHVQKMAYYGLTLMLFEII